MNEPRIAIRSTRGRARRWRAAAALLCLGLAAPAGALAAPSLELQVKAALIFNLAQFVSWPREAVRGTGLVLCVRDAPELAAELARGLQRREIDGRPVEVLAPDGEALDRCHLLYLGDPATLGATLEATRGAPILTVHEAAGPQAGGVVRLLVRRNRLHFEINTAAAEQRRLQISSKLLAMADRVAQ